MANLQPYKKYNAIVYDYATELPEDWQLLPNIAIFQERIERGYENEELLSVTIGRGVIKQSDLDKKDSSTLDKSKYLLVYPNDLVYSMRFRQGASGFSNYKGIVSPACTVLKPRKGVELNSRYYHYMFRTGFYKNYAERYAYGIADGQMPLRYFDFKRMYSVLPPLEVQKNIVDYLDKKNSEIDKFIRNKERLIKLLEEEKIRIIKEKVTKGLDKKLELKDSNEYWIGYTPKHWTVKKLKRCCQVKRGASPRPIDDPAYFNENGEYGWVRISDVTASKKYLEYTEQKLSKRGVSHSIKMEYGDLFLSIAGSVGKPIITKVKCCIHDGFVWFRNIKQVEKEFLYYVFLTGQCFEGLGKIGTQLNLNTDTVGMISIPIPPITEQIEIIKEIIQEENKIDLIVCKAQNEINSIKEYREALITDFVLGKLSLNL
jgi:type I restriction enzyme S subunit